MTSHLPPARIKRLGLVDYQHSWQAMREFTDTRTKTSADEFWLVEHPPVYTLGQAGKTEHILNSQNIPVVHSDRGGQVTYHGPGQSIVYVLVDIKRLGFGARALVSAIENSIIKLLADYDIPAFAKASAPGVYVSANGNDAKIAALGLRIRKACSYHGLSLNVDMNLDPFKGINPCGYEGQAVCQMRDFTPNLDKNRIENRLIQHLSEQLGLKLETYHD